MHVSRLGSSHPKPWKRPSVPSQTSCVAPSFETSPSSANFDKSVQSCGHHHNSDTEVSLSLLPFVALCGRPFPHSQLLSTTDMFSVPHSFILSIKSYKWNHVVCGLCHWLVPLRAMPLRCIHVVEISIVQTSSVQRSASLYSNSFSKWRTFGVLQVLGNYEKNHFKHLCASWRKLFAFLG